MRLGLTSKRAAVAIAAIAMLGTGVGIAAAAGPPMPSGPFFDSGTNGFPAGNKGAAKQVDEGSGGQGALLTSISGGTNQAGFGLVGVHFPGTFSQLTDVETQFNVTQGTCVGGSPRWSFDLQNPNNDKDTQFLLVNFDTQHEPFGGCNAGAQQEANIIGNTSPAAAGWQVDNQNGFSTYAQVNAQYGTWKVQDVEVIVDAGWAQGTQLNPNIQQVLLQNMQINSKTYFPLPH
jgi:hypothetical protein